MLILTKDFSKISYRASQVVLVVKNLPANAGDIRDAGSIPGLGWSYGGANGNPLQYSCLENPMDRGAWWAMGLQRVGQGWGRELDTTEHACACTHTDTHTHTHKSSCRRHGLSYFIIDFSSSTQLYFHFFIFSLPGTYHTSLTLILYIFSFRWVNGVIGLKMLRMYYVEMCNLQETKKCMYLRRLYR